MPSGSVAAGGLHAPLTVRYTVCTSDVSDGEGSAAAREPRLAEYDSCHATAAGAYCRRAGQTTDMLRPHTVLTRGPIGGGHPFFGHLRLGGAILHGLRGTCRLGASLCGGCDRSDVCRPERTPRGAGQTRSSPAPARDPQIASRGAELLCSPVSAAGCAPSSCSAASSAAAVQSAVKIVVSSAARQRQQHRKGHGGAT
jgi:hypothetical protein